MQNRRCESNARAVSALVVVVVDASVVEEIWSERLVVVFGVLARAETSAEEGSAFHKW